MSTVLQPAKGLLLICLTCIWQQTTTGLTSSDRRIALGYHNAVRRLVALGAVKDKRGTRLPKAGNMQLLTYDKGLERQAQAWANNCQWKHDQSRPGGHGENLAAISGPDHSVRAMISLWYHEIDRDPGYMGRGATVDSYCSGRNERTGKCPNWEGLGHFTQMIWADTSAVGCAMANCRGRMAWDWFFVCRYKGSQIIKEPIYQKGEPCSACKKGATCKKGLCPSGQSIASRFSRSGKCAQSSECDGDAACGGVRGACRQTNRYWVLPGGRKQAISQCECSTECKDRRECQSDLHCGNVRTACRKTSEYYVQPGGGKKYISRCLCDTSCKSGNECESDAYCGGRRGACQKSNWYVTGANGRKRFLKKCRC